MTRSKRKIYTDIAVARAKEKEASEEIEALKHKFQKTVLKEAEIVATTLSGFGGNLIKILYQAIRSLVFSENTLFDAVLIDETAQILISFFLLFSLFLFFSPVSIFNHGISFLSSFFHSRSSSLFSFQT